MADPKLINYIREKLAEGYNIDRITVALIKLGYSLKDIQDSTPTTPKIQKTIPSDVSDLPDLFFKPGFFFGDSNNHNFKKALRYFLYSFLVFLLVQTIISIIGVFVGGDGGKMGLLILTSILANSFFIFILFLFLLILTLIYFVLFNYILKIEVGFPLFFTILLFSLIPYILINSVKGLGLHSIITLVNISIGFFNINIFFLWSLFLFSLGISKYLDISFEKSVLAVFLPFMALLVVFIFIFYDILRINLLWRVFEKF